MNFCSKCGGKVIFKMPEDDNRMRFICQSCHFVHYQNPNIVTGILPVWQDKILLCKRAIDPKHGLWTLPAGFMENGETIEQGAKREAYEEATIVVENPFLYNIISLPNINQVYMMFLGELSDEDAEPGVETLETRFFSEDEIPWEQIAFEVITKTLNCYFEDKKSGKFPFRNLVHPSD